MKKIKITPEFWEGKTIKEHGIYKYVGKNPPHYLVNVSSVSPHYVHAWAMNAHGQIVREAIHKEDFTNNFQER